MGGWSHSDIIISLSGTSLYIITITVGDGGGAEYSCCVSLIWKNIYIIWIRLRAIIIQMDDLFPSLHLEFPLPPPPLYVSSVWFYFIFFPYILCFLFLTSFIMHLFVHIFLSLTGLQKLAPRLVRVLIPFVIVAGNTAECAGSTSESYVTATTTTATIYTRQSICIAQWLLGKGLVSPIALEATLRFPLVLVTPVKFSFTCCKILRW